MLKVTFRSIDGEIYNIGAYFDDFFLHKWFADDVVKRIIKEIDNSEVVNGYTIKSNTTGYTFPPTKLSVSAKTLILMWLEPETIFNISFCSDNCLPLFFEIIDKHAKNGKDIIACVHHFLKLPENTSVEVIDGNKNILVTTPTDFLLLANDLLRKNR